ncbi:MAG: hypothetical protein K8H74_20040 [Notoacmeibacter sp.]|nr:hypothetical protein [Notoacmeibacter sp.]
MQWLIVGKHQWKSATWQAYMVASARALEACDKEFCPFSHFPRTGEALVLLRVRRHRSREQLRRKTLKG